MRARSLATLSTVATIALCLAHPALAATIDAASRVDAVTLYPDAALVRRIADVDLPAGASRLVFRGLPASVDPASLRIGGQGEGGVGDSALSLGGIDIKKAPAPVADGAIVTQLRQLCEERDAAQVKADALAAKQAMMQLYAQTGPDKFADAGNAIKPEDWGKAWDAVGAALARNGEDLRLARAAVAEIDARIKAVEAARPTPTPGGATRDVAVDVEAPAAGKFRLALDYRVSGARWTPAYDARLETGGKGGQPRLELIRRAQVAQRTGEDWSDVDLTIAAFPAAGGTQAPQVEPQLIAFYEPPVAMPMAAESMAKSAPAPAPARPDRAQAVEQQSRVEAGAYQAMFHAPGRVSLSADGESKNIRLSTQTPQAGLAWRVAPALDPRAFLTAHYVNGEEAPLLPGAIALYRDGAFVGQTFMKLLPPGEAGDLGFGADERVSVVRAPVKRKENEPTWFGQTKVETREFKTVLRNLHDFPIRAVVTDQTPFSENAAIIVETLAQTTPPSETAPEGKRGLLVWRFDLAPNDSKEIRLAYRMKWPADRNVLVP